MFGLLRLLQKNGFYVPFQLFFLYEPYSEFRDILLVLKYYVFWSVRTVLC
jgi:hypothetical protein